MQEAVQRLNVPTQMVALMTAGEANDEILAAIGAVSFRSFAIHYHLLICPYHSAHYHFAHVLFVIISLIR